MSGVNVTIRKREDIQKIVFQTFIPEDGNILSPVPRAVMAGKVSKEVERAINELKGTKNELRWNDIVKLAFYSPSATYYFNVEDATPPQPSKLSETILFKEFPGDDRDFAGVLTNDIVVGIYPPSPIDKGNAAGYAPKAWKELFRLNLDEDTYSVLVDRIIEHVVSIKRIWQFHRYCTVQVRFGENVLCTFPLYSFTNKSYIPKIKATLDNKLRREQLARDLPRDLPPVEELKMSETPIEKLKGVIDVEKYVNEKPAPPRKPANIDWLYILGTLCEEPFRNTEHRVDHISMDLEMRDGIAWLIVWENLVGGGREVAGEGALKDGNINTAAKHLIGEFFELGMIDLEDYTIAVAQAESELRKHNNSVVR